MARGKSLVPPLSSLVSVVFLALFLWSIGLQSFFPSLRLLQDTQLDFSFFFQTWSLRALSFLWLIPVCLGFLGWSRFLKGLFFPALEKSVAGYLGFSLCIASFSLYILVLGVNGILYWPLTVLFFVPVLWEGVKEWQYLELGKWWRVPQSWGWLGIMPILLWAFEYLSPPLVWDAVLDHFRYAREVSRLHQIPFHWVNHTGDMPKAAELVLAGFWNLGGEPLSKLALLLPALLTTWLLKNFSEGKRDKDSTASWIFWTCPYFLALYAFGYAEGFLAFFEVTALFCVWRGLEDPKKSFWLPLAAFFLGTALVVKYTAVLAVGALFLLIFYETVFQKKKIRMNFSTVFWPLSCQFFLGFLRIGWHLGTRFIPWQHLFLVRRSGTVTKWKRVFWPIRGFLGRQV